MLANRALPLNTNQIGNIRPDIPPSQNNCVEQTERSTMHFFHEKGRGGGGEIQTYCSWSQRRTKLVELEHLQNWENSAVQQAGSARGLAVHRWRAECACAAACIVTYRKQLASADTHSKSLHGHEMNYYITRLNLWHHHVWPMAYSAHSLYKRIKM